MVAAKDVKYIRDCIGCSTLEAKAMAKLLEHAGLDIYSDEAAATMRMRHFNEKAYRFSKWLELKELVDEFGSLED